MDITFNCEGCGQHIAIDEAGAGQLVDCPKCGTPLEVPSKPKPLVKTTTSSSAKMPQWGPARNAEAVSASASSPLPKVLAAFAIVALMVVGGFFAYKIWKNLFSDITLDGQVFIVTKGGENVKLGLVPIAIIPLTDLTPYLSRKEANASKEIARLTALIDEAERKITAAE